MSWDVHLEDRRQKPGCSYGVSIIDFIPDFEGDEPCTVPCYPTVEVPPHSEGGTYIVGGTMEASLNVTYNYGKQFYEAIPYPPGLNFVGWLTNKTGAEAAPLLEAAVAKLGVTRDDNYWAATPGNAGHALSILAKWARQHPTAVFRVD